MNETKQELADPKKCVHSGGVEIFDGLIVCSACHRQLVNVTALQAADALRATRQELVKAEEMLVSNVESREKLIAINRKRIAELEQELASTLEDLDFEKSQRQSTTVTLREHITELEQELDAVNKTIGAQKMLVGLNDIHIAQLEQQILGYQASLEETRQEKELQHVTMANRIYELEQQLAKHWEVIDDEREAHVKELEQQSQRDRKRIGKLEKLVITALSYVHGGYFAGVWVGPWETEARDALHWYYALDEGDVK